MMDHNARNFGFLHPNGVGAIRLLQLLHVRAALPGTPAATTAARPAWRCASRWSCRDGGCCR